MHDFDESEVIPIRYVPTIYLRSGHHKAIRCVAFNEHGSLLATGGDDSHLLIWSSATGMLLHDIETHTIVLSLIWVSTDVLVGGSQDGVLISVRITDEILTVHTIHMNDLAINFLDVSKCRGAVRLALGMADNISVHEKSKDGMSAWWCNIGTLEVPTSCGETFVMSSLEWLDFDQIIASYIHHGLICWRVDRRQALWAMTLGSPCGSISLAPNRQDIAVYNMLTGVDIYDLRTRLTKASMSHRMGYDIPLPVKFIHDGEFLIAGNAMGRVKLWRSRDGHSVDTLDHDGRTVGAISACHDKQHGGYLIATGTSDDNPILCIWEAHLHVPLLNPIQNVHGLWHWISRAAIVLINAFGIIICVSAIIWVQSLKR